MFLFIKNIDTNTCTCYINIVERGVDSMAKVIEDYRGVILFLLVFVVMFSIYRTSIVKINAKIDSNYYNTSAIYEE